MIKFVRGGPVAGVTGMHCSLNGLVVTLHKTLRTDFLSSHLFILRGRRGRHDKGAVG